MGVLYIVAAACRKVVAWVVQVHGSKGRKRGGSKQETVGSGVRQGGGDALRAGEVREIEVSAARCASSGNWCSDSARIGCERPQFLFGASVSGFHLTLISSKERRNLLS